MSGYIGRGRSCNVLEVDLHDGSPRDGLPTRFRLAHRLQVKKDLELARGRVSSRPQLSVLPATVAEIRNIRGVADRIKDAQALHQSDQVLLTADRVILWPPLAV